MHMHTILCMVVVCVSCTATFGFIFAYTREQDSFRGCNLHCTSLQWGKRRIPIFLDNILLLQVHGSTYFSCLHDQLPRRASVYFREFAWLHFFHSTCVPNSAVWRCPGSAARPATTAAPSSSGSAAQPELQNFETRTVSER